MFRWVPPALMWLCHVTVTVQGLEIQGKQACRGPSWTSHVGELGRRGDSLQRQIMKCLEGLVGSNLEMAGWEQSVGCL